MTGFDTLSAIAANPRGIGVTIECACGQHAPVGLPDTNASLPVWCNACGSEFAAAEVLMANLQAARVEIASLGSAIGAVLRLMADAQQIHSHARNRPLDTLRRSVSAIDVATPAWAAFALAINTK